MTIGQLAARTGLSVRTVRFYADAGVLPEATRSEAGYRLFGPEAGLAVGSCARCASSTWASPTSSAW